MPLEAVERLREDAQALLDAGRTVVREYGGAGDAFRRLLLSDIALARVALIRGMVFLMLCTLMAGTAYAGITIMLVLGLQMLGGHGYTKGHPVELWYRNARALSVLEGAAGV